ncbi:unnamed protein product [Candidula unifasciata]|uniref:Serine protease n=1 Tax=Candidula unifasciata TaxID=100452 RepID=A0A8S3YRT8_9EUPU|nr:unnamed protein product [Candidula unifasciata]
MAAGFDISRYFRTQPIDSTPMVCSRCHRLIVLCSCLSSEEAIRQSAFYSDDLFDVDFLDIENAEAQPGSDLDVAAPLCDKSHQHHEFIDVDDLTIEHLPAEIRHCTTYVWLRNCVPLVVRLIRNITATGRACLHSEDYRDTRICDDVHCPYVASLGQGHKLYGGIGIITNKHVVMDDDQAAMTKIEFFYNNDASRTTGLVVKELGAKLYTTNTKMDYTLFTCYVHSRELVQLVATFDRRRNYSWLAIPRHIRKNAKNFAIVISHPHGTSKKISIGNVIERRTQAMSRQEVEDSQIVRSIYDLCESQGGSGRLRFAAYWRQLKDISLPHSVTWYTAPTCKGSSGAPVYMGNTVEEYGEEINQAHTHRGVDNTRGLNNCFT